MGISGRFKVHSSSPLYDSAASGFHISWLRLICNHSWALLWKPQSCNTWQEWNGCGWLPCYSVTFQVLSFLVVGLQEESLEISGQYGRWTYPGDLGPKSALFTGLKWPDILMWHDLHSNQLMPHAHCGREFLPRRVFMWPVWSWIKWLMAIYFSWYFKLRFSSDFLLYNACAETWDAFFWDTCLCIRFDKVSVKGEGLGEKGRWFRSLDMKWVSWAFEQSEQLECLSWSVIGRLHFSARVAARAGSGELRFDLDSIDYRLNMWAAVSHFKTLWFLLFVCFSSKFHPCCVFGSDWGRETFIAKVQMYRA